MRRLRPTTTAAPCHAERSDASRLHVAPSLAAEIPRFWLGMTPRPGPTADTGSPAKPLLSLCMVVPNGRADTAANRFIVHIGGTHATLTHLGAGAPAPHRGDWPRTDSTGGSGHPDCCHALGTAGRHP